MNLNHYRIIPSHIISFFFLLSTIGKVILKIIAIINPIIKGIINFLLQVQDFSGSLYFLYFFDTSFIFRFSTVLSLTNPDFLKRFLKFVFGRMSLEILNLISFLNFSMNFPKYTNLITYLLLK